MHLEIGESKVVVESDRSTVVKLVSKLEGERSKISSIWHDVQELSRNFVSLSLSHVHREANVAAHCCGKFVYSVSIECNWQNGVPNFLAGGLANYCNPAHIIQALVIFPKNQASYMYAFSTTWQY
jgi:hypothetical protein